MSLNKCQNCGCDDALVTLPPCPTPAGCPDPEPCSEVFDAQCIIYTGADIECGTDTVVTTDTHRLIRVNNTLHGKTGFRKIEFPIQSIDTFDPFKEAIVFNGDVVKVLVSDAPLFRIGDKMYGPYKNQIVDLSINAAILLICKDRAKLVKKNV